MVALLILGVAGFAMNMNGGGNVEKAVTNALTQMEIEKAGGDANYELLQQIYASDAFQSQQQQGLQSTLDQLNGAAPSTDDSAAVAPSSSTLTDDQLAAVTTDVVIKGNADAPLMLIEYTDIECPFCKKHYENGTVDQVLENYPDDVQVVIKNFPLSFHPEAQHNAEAIECAKDQADADTVYEFIGALFSADDITESGTIAVAQSVGLDTDALQACMDSGEKTDAVAAEMAEGQSVFGVNGTPGNVILNLETGEYKVVSGAQPYSAFSAAINALLAE
ncbi:MAG: thioredoxin domain-containing protein [Candidatus Peribacteria bacterium]|nr:MAG: thioredoxin domain-containing protein [Candidatus Peribacteria bacterium]